MSRTFVYLAKHQVKRAHTMYVYISFFSYGKYDIALSIKLIN